MDTVAINTGLLEEEIISLARLAGKMKGAIKAGQKKLEGYQNTEEKEKIKELLGELLFMQEELWQYLEHLEVAQRMYEEFHEELTEMVL